MFEWNYSLTSQRKAVSFLRLWPLVITILIRNKPCCCSRLFHVITASRHWHIIADILVGVGKMLWSGLCSKNICGRLLWLALLLLLMHCTWATKCIWKEAILVLKTDDPKIAFSFNVDFRNSRLCFVFLRAATKYFAVFSLWQPVLFLSSFFLFYSFPTLHILIWVSKYCSYNICEF